MEDKIDKLGFLGRLFGKIGKTIVPENMKPLDAATVRPGVGIDPDVNRAMLDRSVRTQAPIEPQQPPTPSIPQSLKP